MGNQTYSNHNIESVEYYPEPEILQESPKIEIQLSYDPYLINYYEETNTFTYNDPWENPEPEQYTHETHETHESVPSIPETNNTNSNSCNSEDNNTSNHIYTPPADSNPISSPAKNSHSENEVSVHSLQVRGG